MSLDVILTSQTPIARRSSGIFIRENGSTREISREEWNDRNPGREPCVLEQQNESRMVYDSNITHNLTAMASAAGIYKHLWRPEEIGITTAVQLIEPLREGLAKLKADPQKYETFNAPNGWGMYEHFVPFVEQYLAACEEYPDASVSVSR